MDAGTQGLGHRRPWAWNWIRSGVARTRANVHMGCRRWWLNVLCHSTSPLKWFLKCIYFILLREREKDKGETKSLYPLVYNFAIDRSGRDPSLNIGTHSGSSVQVTRTWPPELSVLPPKVYISRSQELEVTLPPRPRQCNMDAGVQTGLSSPLNL